VVDVISRGFVRSLTDTCVSGYPADTWSGFTFICLFYRIVLLWNSAMLTGRAVGLQKSCSTRTQRLHLGHIM